ncbi:MAG: hypothetical protein DWQ05_03940 [Calditrichaeota bacterium]|nr:MAG: hypothetical protein DWQ05_03940 [Calditrichota bacterium]
MQFFSRLLLTFLKIFIVGLFLSALYGFPTSCDDNVTDTEDITANCHYEVEEEGMIFQKHLDDYHPWAFRVKKDGYDLIWDLTNPGFVPDGNLPNMYKIDSLRVRITGVRAPENIDNVVRLWAWPFIILRIEIIEN